MAGVGLPEARLARPWKASLLDPGGLLLLHALPEALRPSLG